MSDLWVYRLQPRGRFHFGVRGVGVEASAATGGSDMLFGAICHGVLATQGEDGGPYTLVSMLEAMRAGNPPFLVSSLFPYAGELLFLPRPLGPAGTLAVSRPDGSIAGGKAGHKIAYLSLGLFSSLVSQRAGPTVVSSEDLTQTGILAVTPGERRLLDAFADPDDPMGAIRIWQQGSPAQVAIDRVTSRSVAYQVGGVRFAEGSGLYFFMDWRDPGWKPAVEEALYYLEHEGLGGRRNGGHGAFYLQQPYTLTVPGPPEGVLTARMTLSLYHPRRDEISAFQGAAYQLEQNRGWVGAPGSQSVRRRDVLMLSEGSVLPLAGAGPFGDIVDVTPREWPKNVPKVGEGSIWRYGFALPVEVPDVREESAPLEGVAGSTIVH